MRAWSFVLGSFAVWALTACSGAEGNEDKTARLRIPLMTSGASGRIYRLKNATIGFRGPANSTWEGTDPYPFIEIDLEPGVYDIELFDGWELWTDHRINGARLISPNPAHAVLEQGEVTEVVFMFDTRDTIHVGQGRFDVSIDVLEPLCGNGELDPGEECDYNADNPAECDDKCSGGGKACARNADCASGACADDSSTCMSCSDAGECPLAKQFLAEY
jgi:hypothetical protein